MSRDVLAEILGELEMQPRSVLDAYLRGASRDATVSRQHRTTRFAQAPNGWLKVVQRALARLGRKSWRYREGRRQVWVVETCAAFTPWPDPDSTGREVAAWARGYFDAEGGLPQRHGARLYIQLSQKNFEDLKFLWHSLDRLGIECGRVHNPSRRIDPHYWRFFVRCSSHEKFAGLIGSWHPIKRALLQIAFPPSRDPERYAV